jgi:two-component system phosphate regulon response regulator PhoB
VARKRIIIVEDEKDMAELVALRLRREGYEVELAADGASGLEKIRAAPPDLVLLDLMLPRMSGQEVARRLRDDPRTANIPILMLTARSEESDIVFGLKSSADDYVTKPFSMSILAARVAALLRRSGEPTSAASTKPFIKVGVIDIDQDRHEVKAAGVLAALTLTEFRLLVALAAARGRVLSRNQLIDQTMGIDAIVTDRTIDVHLTALRRKLGEARSYIKTVRGLGYRLSVEDDETA